MRRGEGEMLEGRMKGSEGGDGLERNFGWGNMVRVLMRGVEYLSDLASI
jgi:hypothetical protein